MSNGRFSSAHATEAEFLRDFNSIPHLETCGTLLGVAELAAVLKRTKGTIAFYSSQYPDRLPPRFIPPGGSRSALWRVKDYHAWSEGIAAAVAPPAPTPAPTPAAPAQKKRGRPTNASKATASCRQQ